jgi:hypothetical protein
MKFLSEVVLQSLLKMTGLATGDILTYDGTSLVKLVPGTSGHFLKSNGPGVALSYAAGGGDLVADTTPQLGGVLETNAHQVRESKGADVARAATLTLGNDGNYFFVTGSTTVTAIATKGVGTRVTLRFQTVGWLTHHASNLILPGSQDIYTAANDIAVLREYATGQWICESYTPAVQSTRNEYKIVLNPIDQSELVETAVGSGEYGFLFLGTSEGSGVNLLTIYAVTVGYPVYGSGFGYDTVLFDLLMDGGSRQTFTLAAQVTHHNLGAPFTVSLGSIVSYTLSSSYLTGIGHKGLQVTLHVRE